MEGDRVTIKPKPFVCGIDAAVDVVGGKWKVLILWELSGGTKRFGELRRALTGVSEKMLTQHLRELVRDGAVERTVYESVPPQVEYSLTPEGKELNEALRPLGAWGTRHKAHLEHVRRADASVGTV